MKFQRKVLSSLGKFDFIYILSASFSKNAHPPTHPRPCCLIARGPSKLLFLATKKGLVSCSKIYHFYFLAFGTSVMF